VVFMTSMRRLDQIARAMIQAEARTEDSVVRPVVEHATEKVGDAATYIGEVIGGEE